VPLTGDSSHFLVITTERQLELPAASRAFTTMVLVPW